MIIERLKEIPELRQRALRFLALVFVLAIGYSLTAGNYGFLSIMETREQIVRLEYDEKMYRARLVDLELTRDRLTSDSLYLESLARKKYRMGRQNETIIEF